MTNQRELTRGIAVAIVAVLVLIFFARLLDTGSQKSLTPDEVHYVGTGLYLWESGDYHVVRTLLFHPPLTYHLASLPLLAIDIGDREITRTIGKELMAGGEPGPDRVRRLSRLPFALLSCWGAALMFLWAREAAGLEAGVLAAALYTGSPTMLAYSSLAHSDITVTVLFTQTLYAFWRWTQRQTVTRLLVCGASLGLAMIAKLTAVLLLPSLGLLLLAHAYGLLGVGGKAGRPEGSQPLRWLRPGAAATGRLAALIAIAVAVIWLGYGGSFATHEVETGIFAGVHLPGILEGVRFDVAANQTSRDIYFMGEISDGGEFWYLLPVAFALKTPIPVLLLLGLAVFGRRAREVEVPGARTGVALFAVIPILIFLGLALFWVRVPLGIRYVLPVFPLLAFFVSIRLAPLDGWRRNFAALCLLWLALAGAWIHPHYLAYFNEFIGGPANAHHVLVESNLDWGQDLGTLADELDELGNPEVSLAYFGPESPKKFGIRSKPLRGCKSVYGYVAISATILHGLYDPHNAFARPPEHCYDWLARHKPIAQPGYSILLYHIPGEVPANGS